MLSTSRLVLRPIRESDAADVLAMVVDPDTRRWNPAPGVIDTGTAALWCGRMADWSRGDQVTFAVLDGVDGRFCGNVTIHGIDRRQAFAQIAYRFTPTARGNGVASEAVTAATGWAFQTLSLVRVQLVHAVLNEASCGVAKRAGYSLEGVLRSSFVYGDGLRYDEHIHARLRTDDV